MPLLDSEHLAAPMRKTAQQQEPIYDLLGALAPLLFFGFIILITIILRARGGGGISGNSGRALNNNVWGNAAGVIIGSILSQGGRGNGGFGSGDGGGGFGDGGFSGGGGGFDGGGASGDW